MNKSTIMAGIGLHAAGILAVMAAGAYAATGPAGPLVIMMAPPSTIEALRAQAQDIAAEIDGLIAAADADDRDLTDDELATIEARKADVDRLTRQIQARETASAVAATPSSGRRTVAEPQNGGDRRTVAASPRVDSARGGFRHFGEFAMAVRAEKMGDDGARGRLLAAATTYGNEGTGADGGFLVPAEFRREIWSKVLAEDNLLGRTEQLTTASNNLTIPKDETTPWQTSGGVQVYWEAEGGTKTQSKPLFEPLTMRLNKLIGLVPVTDELLEDAPGLESWLRAKAPAKMAAKINTALLDGTGVGQPLGALRAPSLVTVAKESGQTADTIVFANIVKMWSAAYAPSRRNAIWVINQDIEPQLLAMGFPTSATAVPVYMPAGGLSQSPYATLMGRPVVPLEAAKTLGDLGDITLVDWSQYVTLTKTGGVKTDVSMHLYFDQDITAFRFVFRIAGQPMWGSSVTPQNGTQARSWAVALAERA